MKELNLEDVHQLAAGVSIKMPPQSSKFAGEFEFQQQTKPTYLMRSTVPAMSVPSTL
jgi:hypothetical protein